MPAELAAAWRQAAAAVIGAAMPGDPADPGCWPVFAALLPHAQAALDPASDGMYQVARYLGESGSYAAALAVQQQVLHAREETRGAEHPDYAHRPRLPGPLDRGGGGCGRGPGPVRRAAAGPRAGLRAEHPDTLTARDSLARWTGNAGDAAGARDQYAALLPVRERVSGAEHPDTLDRPRQPGLLDRGGGGSGRGPGPVRRAAAGLRAGLRRGAPGHPDHPRQPRPLDRGRRGMRPGPGTSTPRCCRSASGSSAPSTPTP